MHSGIVFSGNHTCNAAFMFGYNEIYIICLIIANIIKQCCCLLEEYLQSCQAAHHVLEQSYCVAETGKTALTGSQLFAQFVLILGWLIVV